MANYYEILQVSPAATAPEIEVTLDRLYNETRRKVTNADPGIAAQASQGLQMIEQMRAILLSPDKRAAYDAALGIGSQSGGLFDPEAVFRTPAPAAPPAPTLGMPSVSMQFGQPAGPLVPPVQPQDTQLVVRTDAWICPTCQHANPVGVQFCAKDGIKIGHACPQCGGMAELAKDYCPACGADKRRVYDEKIRAEVEQVQTQMRSIQSRMERLERVASLSSGSGLGPQDAAVFQELRQGSSNTGCVLWAVSGGVLLLVTMLFSAIFNDTGAAFFFGLIAAGGAYFFVRSKVNKGSAQKKAAQLSMALQSQLPALQRKLTELEARQYPN